MTEWTFDDGVRSISFDGVTNIEGEGGGPPTVTVGQEFEVQGFWNDGSPDYEYLKHYSEHLTEKAVDFGNTFNGEPWFRQNVQPFSDVSSYVFDVSPDEEITGVTGFYGLLIDAQDNTRIAGVNGQRFTMTFVILARKEDFNTRDEVIEAYEAPL